MAVLEPTTMALGLAKELIQAGALPAKSADDALHIAIAATHAIPFLLTWNCRHLANATMRPVIESVCAAKDSRRLLSVRPRSFRSQRHE